MASSAPVMIETSHEDMIHDAQFDYYAKKVATASSDRTIQIYDITDDVYNKSAVLTGHEGPVWQVAWAHPKYGVLLASCSYDGQVILHRESPPGVWSQIHSHRFHEASVNSVSWAPHEQGLLLACAGADGRVSVLSHNADDTWSAAHFQDSPLGCNAVSWAPAAAVGAADAAAAAGEGPAAAAGGPRRLATGSCDNKVRFWRSVDGLSWSEEPKQQDPHRDWVRDVAWAPAGGLPCNLVASGSEDGACYVWTQTAQTPAWCPQLVHRFDAPVWRVSWSVTGNVLAVSAGDHEVTLWKQGLDGAWARLSAVGEAGAVPEPQPAS
eukprot:CAMPEP_0194585914 /NCGR_PEP_ID=MMETSP0292-20121207/18076_1 /TAXON_ID=39354 /ORGANISM="Heterosigma akashiwo, Strain CCMP2393" /LENGTH=322 /DNA_ID=CAMNT_0039441533 /DNA_START=64 /DNA_END=1032 /DNA_ORIENTATION=+